MAPVTSEAKTEQPSKAQLKLNVKKATDEEFLLTLLENVKVDHGAASKSLGISKAACRMRLVRLRQKYGLKIKGKGTPRGKKEKASSNNEEETAGEEATNDNTTEN
ncbi:hypothetical protein PCG10_001530 [Penicillium crustosum]|uniref:Myb-like DNA-binding domain-containing protein n=1 Tax=Penicillium crustosum TaxID=36656 RepID=A0A9P5GFS9_PENCR|nr:uncharacterized protein N7487_006594 [Penicillium crustosum]KAF7517212.1 hypothetical protein PCG10_001530 [Penicillium crustosum]KAJ5412235.1 hypothetical protein N7487_006594 [Penicillium crustosum]